MVVDAAALQRFDSSRAGRPAGTAAHVPEPGQAASMPCRVGLPHLADLATLYGIDGLLRTS